MTTDAERATLATQALDSALSALRDLSYDLRMAAVMAGEHEAAGDALTALCAGLITGCTQQRARIAEQVTR